VKTKLLNGRATPSKKASIEAFFDEGDPLKATGNWSPDYQWIEVGGGETGTVWVHIKYVSERKGYFQAKNEIFKQVKIRSHPVNGKLKGYIKKNETVEITHVVLGWGRCSKGWVDMNYLEEIQ
jgi:SH3-like domain-containing protein